MSWGQWPDRNRSQSLLCDYSLRANLGLGRFGKETGGGMGFRFGTAVVPLRKALAARIDVELLPVRYLTAQLV